MTSDTLLIPLLVSSNEENLVSALGATWDANEKCYCWPVDQDRKPVTKWLPRIYRRDLTTPHVRPMLVPESMWGVNLRSLLSKEDWNKLRHQCYRASSHRCQVCGVRGDPPHCNEQWEFRYNPPHDPEAYIGTQYLARLACLCKPCHMVKHLGFAKISNQLEKTIEHMAQINEWSPEEARYAADKAFDDWDIRNKYQWKLDLSLLEIKYQICISIPEEDLRKINKTFLTTIRQ